MENEPRRGDSVTPHTGFRGSRSCTISIIDSVQFQIIDDINNPVFFGDGAAARWLPEILWTWILQHANGPP